MGIENNLDGLDGLLMGNVSEEVSESNEQFQARIAAAQAQLQKVQKDEKKAQIFDIQLAKIIPTLPNDLLRMVIFGVNREVPSLTILAFLSLVIDEAGRICYQEFHKYIEEPADFSMVRFESPQVQDKFSWWWTFIVGADHVSTTIRLRDLRGDIDFVREISHFLSLLVEQFLKNYPEGVFDNAQLQHILKKYAQALFEESSSLTS